jgi:cysteine desulfurase/selenocysteine lyase
LLRADFPILATRADDGTPLVYLDNAASTQRPRQVLEAMNHVYEHTYSNVHRGIHRLSEQCTALYEQARDTVRHFVGAAEREEIVFTRGTTESINLVARSWGDANLGEGDEILLTLMEHHANIVPWQQLAERTGALIRWVSLTDDGRLDLTDLQRRLTDRTRLVAVAAVSNVLGTINPVAQIARLAHDANALLLVDAAQSAPHQPTDVQSLGADFLAFSGHKLLGPTGVGVLYGRRELMEAMPPYSGGGSMIRRVTLDGFEPAELPAKFEAGTPPIVEAIGLAAAIEYLERVGLSAIHDHEQRLAVRAHELLAGIEGLRFLGPAPEHKAGIVSFTVDGLHPHDAAQLLDGDGIAVRAGHHCAMPLHKHLKIPASTRASFYLYNTPDEVEQLATALTAAQQRFRRRARQ